MPKILFVDVEKCVGCRTCEMVCSLSHAKEVNPVRSRINVFKWENEGHCIPMNCRHCETAPCVAICPKQAIQHTENPYGVAIDLKKCIGCRSCLLVCPFGAISFESESKTVVKCDLCNGDPLCVKFCAYGALQYIDSDLLNKDRQGFAAKKLFELEFVNDSHCE